MPYPASDTDNAKPLLSVLGGNCAKIPPVWLMRQAGRYLAEYRALRARVPDFLTFCYTPDMAIEATLQPVKKYRFDAAILFSDILVIPDAMGQSVRFEEGVGPVLERLRDVADIERLQPARVHHHLAPVMRAVEGIAGGLDDRTTLIGFAGAPWTVALYMVEGRGGTEGETLRRWSYEDPLAIELLMDRLVEATSAYLIAQVRHGAEVLQLFDSWAGLVPDGFFERWIIAPTAQIIAEVRRVYPDIPIIGFPRNTGLKMEAYLHGTRVNGIGLDAGVPLEWARTCLQPHVAVQGNLDNQLLVVGGQVMDAAVDRICRILSDRPFIFNLGHGILPQTPAEHVARLVERIRKSRTT